jgi:uncharacterized protein YigE (DUF2233 family)
MVHKYLALNTRGVTVRQVYPAGPNRLHLGAGKQNTRLDPVDHFVIVKRFIVLRDNLHNYRKIINCKRYVVMRFGFLYIYNIMNPKFIATLILVLAINATAQWRKLDDGLHLGKFSSPHYGPPSHAAINVLRIDTKHYELRLLNASHPSQGEIMTARRWAKKEGMAATINAAMYQTDYRSSVSHMKTSEHVNNNYISKDKTILVFEPLKKGIPPARIVDLQCDDFEMISKDYGSAVQSIRMISCDGRNVWQASEKKWSIVAVGVDKEGNILFIQCTAPHSVYEFNNILRQLPIGIERAMYMEGGGPSQMFIGVGADTLEFIGNFSGGGQPAGAAELPNVLGIRKVKK